MRQFPEIFTHCVHWGDNHTHFFPQCLDPESDSSQLKYCVGSTCSFIFSGRKRRAKSQEIHDDDHMMKSQFPLKSFKIKATFKKSLERWSKSYWFEMSRTQFRTFFVRFVKSWKNVYFEFSCQKYIFFLNKNSNLFGFSRLNFKISVISTFKQFGKTKNIFGAKIQTFWVEKCQKIHISLGFSLQLLGAKILIVI